MDTIIWNDDKTYIIDLMKHGKIRNKNKKRKNRRNKNYCIKLLPSLRTNGSIFIV